VEVAGGFLSGVLSDMGQREPKRPRPRLLAHDNAERRALDGGIAPPCARSGPHGRVDRLGNSPATTARGLRAR
jgi:hypothetical protein